MPPGARRQTTSSHSSRLPPHPARFSLPEVARCTTSGSQNRGGLRSSAALEVEDWGREGSMRLESVTIDARDPQVLADFWAKVLGWTANAEPEGDVELRPDTDDPVRRYPTLVFVPEDEPEAGRD